MKYFNDYEILQEEIIKGGYRVTDIKIEETIPYTDTKVVVIILAKQGKRYKISIETSRGEIEGSDLRKQFRKIESEEAIEEEEEQENE